MSSEGNFPESKHFTIEPLAEGIYAAIARDGGAAICNAGIVDLGESCLVFDTFLTPGAAADLLQTVKYLVGRPPDFVINSHYHNDHIWGNQVFAPPAHIVASRQTYELISTSGKKELEDETATASQSLAHFRELSQNAETEAQRNAAKMFLGFYEGLVQDLPRLSVRMPDITYKERLTFHGAKHSAELIAYDNCHTGNDAVLFLPNEGILFMSDLLFVGCHPYLGDGDPANLVSVLKEILDLGASRFVPGHGMPGTKEDVNLLIEYVGDCEKTAQILVKEGRADRESIGKAEVPERYKDWQFPMFYRANLRFLCGRLAG